MEIVHSREKQGGRTPNRAGTEGEGGKRTINEQNSNKKKSTISAVTFKKKKWTSTRTHQVKRVRKKRVKKNPLLWGIVPAVVHLHLRGNKE